MVPTVSIKVLIRPAVDVKADIGHPIIVYDALLTNKILIQVVNLKQETQSEIGVAFCLTG